MNENTQNIFLRVKKVKFPVFNLYSQHKQDFTHKQSVFIKITGSRYILYTGNDRVQCS